MNIKSGIFQGDSLSPLLFCLALEPLENAVEVYRTRISWHKNKSPMDGLSPKAI